MCFDSVPNFNIKHAEVTAISKKVLQKEGEDKYEENKMNFKGAYQK